MKRLKFFNEPCSRRVFQTTFLILGGWCWSHSWCVYAEIKVNSSILLPSSTIEIPATDSGLLLQLAVSEGDPVVANRVLGKIDAREQELFAEIARRDLQTVVKEQSNNISVRVAKKEHRVAVAELTRANTANRQLANTVATKEVERLQLAVDRTELEIEYAEFQRTLLSARIEKLKADLRLAEFRVERPCLRSPIDGVVSKIHKHTGEWVDAGEPVIRLVSLRKLRLEGYIPVSAALPGIVGCEVDVEVSLESGDKITSKGKVTYVSPEAETMNSKVKFWAEIDNQNMKLRPGLPAVAVIHNRAVSTETVSESQPSGSP